jgi:hypothetical protein
MGKYGDAAVRAAELLRSDRGSAEAAWREVADELFADAPAARRKTCPREAFLGLCQAGLLAGVSASRCAISESGRNRLYATMAVRLLRADPSLARGSRVELWRRVVKEVGADPNKVPNSQMDVVLALWAARLITPSAEPSN